MSEISYVRRLENHSSVLVDKNWGTDEAVWTGILSWVMKQQVLVLPSFKHFWCTSTLFGLGQQICD
jgi:hypothetical protein